MKQINQDHGTAIILVTHDLGLASEFCDRIAVMYAGRIIEQGTVDEIVETSKHPYTQGSVITSYSIHYTKLYDLYAKNGGFMENERIGAWRFIKKHSKRYFIDALGAMALGLFASLIIGLILTQMINLIWPQIGAGVTLTRFRNNFV